MCHVKHTVRQYDPSLRSVLLLDQRHAIPAGKKCVLGLATGSTPVMVYRELVRMHKEGSLSFRNVITFNLDEYHGTSPDDLQSYHRFMARKSDP